MSLFDQIDTAGYDPSKSFTDNLIASMPPTDLAQALGINDIDQAAAQAKAMNAPAAPTFGAGASPFQFPQSAAFGAPLPAPAAPTVPPVVANANAPAAPQNAPIAVGNYQMPRIGSGFNPSTAPPAAPATPAAAPSFLDSARNHLDASALSMGHGGGLIGGLTALVTGQRHDPQNEALQLQQAQLQKQVAALVNAGVPQKQAVLAVLNPEAAKSIIPQYVGPDKNKFIKIGQDGLGREQYGFVNEQDKTVTPVKSPGGDNSDAGLGDMSKTGADYLATLPPQQRGTVQAMVEGRMAPPSSFALSKPYWQNMIAAAQNVDPSFDATNWSGRVAGVKSFKAGADAGTVRSANQVLGHISDLTDKADDLHNGDYPAWNYVKNKWNSNVGEDAANNWTTQAHAVGDELSSFMKGAGHSSDTEIKQWQESLSPNMSPQQQRGAIKTLMGIYDHALSALEDKRTGAIGSVAAEKMGPLVTPAGTERHGQGA